MIAPIRSAMGVYQGTRRIGEIVDLGKQAGVMAYLITLGDRRVVLGTYRDRKAAMVAVSNAQAANEPRPGPEAA